MRFALNHCQRSDNVETSTSTLTGHCVLTGVEYSVSLPKDKLDNYNPGLLIQDSFPDLSLDDREFLVSGICPAAFDDLFEDDQPSLRPQDLPHGCDGLPMV